MLRFSLARAFTTATVAPGPLAGVQILLPDDLRGRSFSHPVLEPLTDLTDGSHALGPADWATIYDVNPVYLAGFRGSGISIAVVGQSDIDVSDVKTRKTTNPMEPGFASSLEGHGTTIRIFLQMGNG